MDQSHWGLSMKQETQSFHQVQPPTAVGSGVYKYTLQAQTDLKRLTVTWNGTWEQQSQTFLTQHEVIPWVLCNTS